MLKNLLIIEACPARDAAVHRFRFFALPVIRFLALPLILGIALAVVASIPSAASPTREAAPTDPMAMVKSTVSKVLDVLKDHQMSREDRRRKLIDLVAGHFDFTDMARLTLGRHWRDLSSDQRKEFVPLFTSFMEDVYLNKLESYSGQKIEFVNEISDGATEVVTKVLQPNNEGQPVQINYQLKRQGGEWKVYDVTVDDISITANYRNQFNRVINGQGFDALMNQMRHKQQELLASLGK